MFEGSVKNESVLSRISYKSFKISNLPTQKSNCDHMQTLRQSVNWPIPWVCGILQYYYVGLEIKFSL